MIKEIQDAIIARLEGISGIAELGAYVGDVEDIIKSPQRMPALHVVYQGANFLPDRVIGSNQAKLTPEFLVVLVARNLKRSVETSEAAYTLIESVRTQLTGYVVGTYGYLWPVSEDLILSEKGILCYGLKYQMETKTE